MPKQYIGLFLHILHLHGSDMVAYRSTRTFTLLGVEAYFGIQFLYLFRYYKKSYIPLPNFSVGGLCSRMAGLFASIKRQSHRAYDHDLRPSCDLKMLESWENRRLIARLVAEVLGDRGWSWMIVRANQSQQTVQKLLRWDFKSQRSHTSGT